MTAPAPRSAAWIMLPFFLTPVASFLFRLVNALIAPELVAEFDLDASALGFVTAAFFIGFGLMQLPMGVLFDRMGPRPVMVALIALGMSGALVFSAADGAAMLTLGRFMIGLGMAGSVMGGLKAANVWLARERVPLMNSLLFGMTGIGGMIATVPVAELLKVLDWRGTILVLAAFLVVVGTLVAILVPTMPAAPGGRQRLSTQLRELGQVFRSPTFWRLTPMAMTAIAGFSVYQSLWTPVWLRDVLGFDREAQAWTLFLILASTAVSNFAFGWLAQGMARRGRDIMSVVVPGIMVQVCLQLWLALAPPSYGDLLWVAMGLCFGAPLALYPVITSHFSVALAGRANAAVNLLAFATSFLLQWGVGAVIDLFPHGAGARYSTEGHAAALIAVAGLQVAAVVWFVFRRPRRAPPLS